LQPHNPLRKQPSGQREALAGHEGGGGSTTGGGRVSVVYTTSALSTDRYVSAIAGTGGLRDFREGESGIEARRRARAAASVGRGAEGNDASANVFSVWVVQVRTPHDSDSVSSLPTV